MAGPMPSMTAISHNRLEHSDRVSMPCATVAPNGPSSARSGSTWIHCSSRVTSANSLILDWSTVSQSLVPRWVPTMARRSSMPTITRGPGCWGTVPSVARDGTSSFTVIVVKSSLPRWGTHGPCRPKAQMNCRRDHVRSPVGIPVGSPVGMPAGTLAGMPGMRGTVRSGLSSAAARTCWPGRRS